MFLGKKAHKIIIKKQIYKNCGQNNGGFLAGGLVSMPIKTWP
jgi:hypothetical protein